MSVELNETDVRELNWVADLIEHVLENGTEGLTESDVRAVVQLIRSKARQACPECGTSAR